MDRRWAMAAFGCVLALGGCRGQVNAGCITGESRACACTNGDTGAQVCLSDGTFDVCACEGGDGGGGGTDGGSGGTDSGMPGPLTFTFSGSITYVDDTAALTGITVGMPFTGSYSYTAGVVDSNSDPTIGDYDYAAMPAGIHVTVNGSTYETRPLMVEFLVEVSDRAPPPASTGDAYLLRSYSNRVVPGPTPVIDHIAWQLDDDTGTAITGDALPLTAPDLTAFSQAAGLTIEGCDMADPTFGCLMALNTFLIRGVVDTIN